MMQNDASLSHLRDIVEPPPVSWWPLASGWWVVIGVAVVALAVSTWRAWQMWKSNAYRRAALAELGSASHDAEIAEVLKRTALGVFPRNTVASLTGEDWCRWLSLTASVDIPDAAAERLTRGVYSEPSTKTDELADFARQWIKQHRIESEGRNDCEVAHGDSTSVSSRPPVPSLKC